MTIELASMLTLLLVVGFLAQWFAWRVRVPAILFLLLTGIVLGPVTGLFDPDKVLGPMLFPAVSLAVALILFEASLTLRFAELRDVGKAVRGLATHGALVALVLLAAAAHWIAGLRWEFAFLFGALTCVTGPTVIMPLLRTLRPNARIASVLRWEGILVDPLGALLAVLVFEAIISQEQGHSLGVFGLTVLNGTVIGIAVAWATGWLLRRHLIPEYLQNFGVLIAVLGAFSLSNELTHESGLLAVTVMGIWLGNMREVHIEDIMGFEEHLSTLLISMLFVVLGARLHWPLPPGVLASGIIVFLVAQFLVRPISVLAATVGTQLNWRERALISYVAPRGVVAAAVSSLFALRLAHHGLTETDALVPLVFILILGTVILESITARPLAKWLKVADPDPNGVLIFGADAVVRAVATALVEQKVRVLVVDDDWDDIAAARMAGLDTFYGNPTSQHAASHLDLTGIGRLLAMSTRRELNSLAYMQYRQILGREKVYRLRILAAAESHDRAAFAESMQSKVLFRDTMTHARFDDLLEAGWRVKSTALTDTFGWAHLIEHVGPDAILLFAIGANGALHVASNKRDLDPKPGWTVIMLVPPAPG